MTKKRGVPEGWLPISAMGKPITGTRFLAFKVPLKDAVCNNLAPNDRFSPTILLEKEPNLRLVIDLTNTKKYYDKNEFVQNGVNYYKIFCPGREIPGNKLMRKFFTVVDNFMQSDDTQDKFIGVHCTHGINRTGYFICKYMIQKLGFTPEQAISAFQDARGHDIVREYLVNEIKKGEKIPEKTEISDSETLPNPSNNHHQNHHPTSLKSSKKSFRKHQDPFYRNRPQQNCSYGNHRFQSYPTQAPPKDLYGRQSQLNYYDEYNNGRSQRNQSRRQNSRHTWRRDDNKDRKDSNT